MRFSDQFQRYQREFANHNQPNGSITCTWMRRTRGKLPKLAEVVVSSEAAAHFRIEAPRLLDKEKAIRIIRWQAARGREATKLLTFP